MSNAMKKLKLLHQLTAPANYSNSFPTPPAPQQCADVTGVLRSARQALNTLHYAPQPQPPPQSSHKRMLPQPFMVLTPNDPHPAICLPASPHYRHNQPAAVPIAQRGPIYSSRLSNPPPPPPSPSRRRSPPDCCRPKLSLENVSRLEKDSRMARWERIIAFVRTQRRRPGSPISPATAASLRSAGDGEASGSYYASTSPSQLARKSSIAEIEKRSRMLDRIDIDAQDSRSLWSGGSAGTDGVDEFVWSEDGDDDEEDEELVVEVQVDEGEMRRRQYLPVAAGHQQQQQRQYHNHHHHQSQQQQLQQLQRQKRSASSCSTTEDEGVFMLEDEHSRPSRASMESSPPKYPGQLPNGELGQGFRDYMHLLKSYEVRRVSPPAHNMSSFGRDMRWGGEVGAY